MPSLLLRRCAAACLFSLAASTAYAAPFMIVGNDEKLGTDAQGKSIVNPTGNDTVLIVDLAKPEEPKIVATLKLENSIVGPPVNLAISPNGSIALVADSMTVADDNGTRKLAPVDKLFVIDLKADPPKLADTVTVGKQPSGLSFSPNGDLALVCNRADGTISVLKIDGTKVTQTGTVQVSPGVSHVVFTPDGKHALAIKSPDNKVAILNVDGDKVSYDKQDVPTYAFPYNVVVSPDGKLAITADNGNGGSSDGSSGCGNGDRPGRPASARDRARHRWRRAGGVGDQSEGQSRRGAERGWLQPEAGVVLSSDRQRHDPAHPGQDGDADKDDRGRSFPRGDRLHAGWSIYLRW